MSPPIKICCTALLALSLAAAGRAEVKAGDAFPSLAAAGLRGTLPATAGQVVLVDFWASWCAPCKASFPVYAKIHGDFAARGLVIVAVSIDENVPDYDRFVRKLAPPFATLLDPGRKLVGQVEVPTMPTSYLVGRDGRVRFVHSGFHDDTERELRQEIETLLAEKTPAP
jgi:thiol-disulfide isomerase/thioredoxin